LTPGLRPEEPVGTRDIGITFPDVIQAGIGTLRLAMQRAIGLFQYPSIPRDLTRHGGTCANRQDAGGAGDQARSQPAARLSLIMNPPLSCRLRMELPPATAGAALMRSSMTPVNRYSRPR
jgi:hypothetical protein